MKALNTLSNQKKTLMLFGLLALNISWMGHSQFNSSDMASTNGITVGGGVSRFCPNLSEALHTAMLEKDNGNSVTLECNAGRGEMGDDNVSVSRKLTIRAQVVEVTEGQDLIGSTGEGRTYQALRFSIMPEVGTEATNCSECARTFGTEIIEDIEMNGQTSISQAAQRLGQRVDDMLNTTQDRMLRSAEDILAAAEREAREEELEEARRELAHRCEIRRDTPLDVVEEYQNGDVDENFALEGEDRLNCFRTELSVIGNAQERADYFYANLMPYLEGQLTTGDRDTQRDALSFINSFYSNGSSRNRLMSIPGASDALQLSIQGHGLHAQATALASQAANNPDNPGIQMQMDQLRLIMNSKFGMLEQTSQPGSEINRQANFWNTQVNTALSPASMDPLNIAAQNLANGLVIGSNRSSRVIPGVTTYYDPTMINDVRSYAASLYPSVYGSSGTTVPGTGLSVTAPPVMGQTQAPVNQVVTPPQAGQRVPRIPVN